MAGDVMDAVAHLGVRVGDAVRDEALVDRLPRGAAVVAAERARRRDRDHDPLRVRRIEQDGVQAQTAGARLPLRPRPVLAQAGQLVPRRAAVGGAEHRGVLDAGVDRVRIAQRRLEVPHPLELPRVRRAVVVLVRPGYAVVLERVVDGIEGLAAVVRSLHQLPEPAAALRHVDPVRIDRRSLEVVDLPAGEVRPADLPGPAGAVRRQDEGALPGAHQHTHCAHEKRLRAPPTDGTPYLMPTTIESGPTSGSVRVDVKPASFIQPSQSAPV